MGLILKYVRLSKSGTWHYKRRLPKGVSESLNQGEFKRRLGDTEREAFKNWPKVNAEFERLVVETRKRTTGLPSDATALDIHRAAEKWARELAQMSVFVGGETLPGSDPEAAYLIRDSMLSEYLIDPETDEPVGVPDVKARALALLANQGKLKRPAPTLEDAKRLYLKERVKGDINERQRTLRIERIVGHLVAASVEKERPLAKITREDARNVRDYLLRDINMNPATARRYLNVIRAVVNFGLTEFELRNVQNPFLSLPVKIETPALEERNPIPEEMLPSIRDRIRGHAKSDLWSIWRIMQNTGARLGEVTGLLISDLSLDTDIPHFAVTSHPHRRIKAESSVRKVPLVGEALEAAREAREAAGDSAFLFPDYGRVRGSDSASGALMGHIRMVTDDPKLGNHSLRHRMEWTAPGLADNSQPHAAALSNASGLTPPRWEWRRVRL